jgi:hypothetical protein
MQLNKARKLKSGKLKVIEMNMRQGIQNIGTRGGVALQAACGSLILTPLSRTHGLRSVAGCVHHGDGERSRTRRIRTVGEWMD